MKVDLEALDALEKKATPPDWYDASCCTLHGSDNMEIAHPYNCADVPFMAALRNAYPAMRDELIAARKVVEAANWQPDAIDSLKSALREYQDKYGQLPPTGKA